jgi:predicted MFS family arabinose efflux permease
MAMQRYVTKALEELGLVSIYKSPRDTKLLCMQRFVRLFAYGGSTLILVSYLSELGISYSKTGLFMTMTLVGDVLISFCLTLVADGLGRKTILALGAALMAGSGVIFGLSGNYWVLLAAAIFGVISPRYELLGIIP